MFLQSVSNAPQGNMYGKLITPSFVHCSGLEGSGLEDIELNLETNTALNNGFKASSTYFLAGLLMTATDGTAPTPTYVGLGATQIFDGSNSAPNLSNRTAIVGLGHVVSRQEVSCQSRELGVRLEVIVAHNDWDGENKVHKRFLAKYVVPGTKNLIKTHLLYQIGQELQLFGTLVDF
ncbi:hypothetical protein PCANC_22453 [Puccinia coronata f. sp. avenae]|uniref:Uncharacterized protein n=1 Tax=Puccinia coronata f. sp. avenae TaxID=200324 RepID=A0A2N5S4D9_9BASI|nr:hypothetical protein PCANC_22453 [Puccinia coronata f. sp. avenae]